MANLTTHVTERHMRRRLVEMARRCHPENIFLLKPAATRKKQLSSSNYWTMHKPIFVTSCDFGQQRTYLFISIKKSQENIVYLSQLAHRTETESGLYLFFLYLTLIWPLKPSRLERMLSDCIFVRSSPTLQKKYLRLIRTTFVTSYEYKRT